MRWRGPSTFAAPTWRIRRWCSAFPSFQRRAGRRSMSMAASSTMSCATTIETLADVREPDAFADDLATLGHAHKTVRLDQATAADALRGIIADAGGKIARGPDPITAMKAVKNAAEIAGSARGASARRRGGDALSRLARARSAIRQAQRNRGGRGAGEFPARHRRAEGCFVSDDFRRRAERRHRALPRYRKNQPQDSTRRTVSDRFRRAIRGRHHRHHPHRRRRHAERRKCATASPAC